MKKISNLMRKCRYGLLLALCGAVMITSCSIIKPIPIETNTEVHIKDSTIYNYIDSIRITEATRYRDFAWMNDTLKLNGNRSRAWAVADTLKGCLIGEIEEDKVEEKTRIVYKDRIQYRDSIQYVEKPVPVEIEKKIKVYPRWMIVLSILGIISTLVISFQVYLKIKKR